MLELAQFVARHRLLLVVWTIAGVAAGLLAAVLMTRVYRAEVKMLPAESRGVDMNSGVLDQLGGLAGLAGIELNAGSTAKSAAIEILRSRSLARKFILENGIVDVLLGHPAFLTAKAKSPDTPIEPERINAAVRKFDEKVRSISEDRRTGIITLSIDWSNPQTAAAWANGLVASLNQEMRARARDDTRQSMQYLDRQLQQTNAVEVRQAIYRLMEHELKTAMLAEVSEEYALRIVDPAMVPDKRRYIQPKPFLLGFGGVAFGILVAAGIGVLRDVRRVGDE